MQRIHTTVLRPFYRDHPGELVAEENFWTLCCKGRLTEADTLTIQMGATPSGLSSSDVCHPPSPIQKYIANAQYLAGLQNLYVLLKNGVSVFLNETFNLVFDTVGKMMNDEGSSRHPRLLKVHISPVFAVQFLTPVLIRSILQLSNKTNTNVFHKLYSLKHMQMSCQRVIKSVHGH